MIGEYQRPPAVLHLTDDRRPVVALHTGTGQKDCLSSLKGKCDAGGGDGVALIDRLGSLPFRIVGVLADG